VESEVGGWMYAAASRLIGWDPIDSTPQTEFGEQPFVARRAQTDNQCAQANSQWESLGDRPFRFGRESVKILNMWRFRLVAGGGFEPRAAIDNT